MPPRRSRLQLALTALLIVSAVVFAAGVAAERSAAAESGHFVASQAGASGEAIHADGDERREQSEQSGETHIEGASESSSVESVGGESDERGGAITSAEDNHPREHTGEDAERAVFGIDPEADVTVATAIIVPFLLAAAVWLWPMPIVLGLVAVFAAIFVILDVQEVLHQLSESHTGLIALAAMLALLHLAIAAIALAAARESGHHASAAAV
jgi:hypothetical protein